MTSRNTARGRKRIATTRAADAKRNRLRKIAILGSLAAAGLVAAVWGIMMRQPEHITPAVQSVAAAQAEQGGGLPPWGLPADPVKGARRAGLSVQPMEGAVKHFHSHMDIIVNGKPIPVAANLGVSAAEQVMSELHTHDASGVIHIEAPTANKRYALGQLFAEWQIRLDSTHLGGLTAGERNVLRAYVNGKQVHGDPSTIELLPRQEIALVYGPADERVNVPSTYQFPADLGEVLPAG